MRRLYLFVALLFFTSATALAQTNISGTVNDENGEGLAGVNIIVKGKVIGTVTDVNGAFNLDIKDFPPLVLVFSFVGFETQEIPVNTPQDLKLKITMKEATLLGQEVVISASRVEEKIMESPVSIEKMDILQVQNTPADNYYKGLANLKGVDVTTSSINFQIINTRGFGSTGNTRFVQLTDGMDTQAPALNFPIGNLNGPSELDVESAELIPGASSALYGPNAFNGILLVNSKSPFDYQGLSAFAKAGVNHVGNDPDASASPVWEGALRYAKAFNNRFAIKANVSYMKALDWYGDSGLDRESGRTPQGFSFNPGPDRLHYMGDEASVNLGYLNYAAQNAYALNGTPYDSKDLASLRAVFDGILGPSASAQGQNISNYFPFIPGHTVSRTPYKESDLIDYHAKNLKASAGLYYRLNDKVELSVLYNHGSGTSIYTGAQRYSLKNFGIDQYRLQLRGDNFFVRAYTTQENSGDSYITEFLGITVNQAWESNNGYFAKYTANFLNYFAGTNIPGGTGLGLSPSQIAALTPDQLLVDQEAAHQYARLQVDKARYNPGQLNFETEKQKQINGKTIPNGPRFNDRSALYHAEGQYDFKNEVKVIELQAGGSFRMFNLNSNGTIFDDSLKDIRIKEYGAYVQAGKWLGDRKVKLSASGRYDKNQNFKGRFNPRLSALYKFNENSNIRVSYQTGFRIPSTQGQYIDLNIISSRLLGGLPQFADKYKLFRQGDGTGQNLSFDGASVEQYTKQVYDAGAKPTDITGPATAQLKPFVWTPVKPERVQNIEVGYKSLFNNNLLVDAVYYYNIYNDFMTQTRVRVASQFTDDPTKQNTPGYTYNPGATPGTPNYASLLSATAFTINGAEQVEGNTAQIYTNYDKTITSQGAVLGLTYMMLRGYTIGGNYNWNVLQKAPANKDFYSEFNTPEHKVNLNFGNRKVTNNFGFNINMRWQSAFEWQSSFTVPANGMVPSYTTVDAQLSYKISSMKSVVKVGGSNLLNTRYIQSLGGPTIGALYYVSLTFDELTR